VIIMELNVPYVKKIKEETPTVLKIKSLYKSLAEAEQRVAKYICENEEEIIYLSVTELAERCQSSEATVIRTCRKLGYSGYQDLKISVARELVTPIAKIHEEVSLDDNCYQVLGKIFNSIIQTLQYTIKVIDQQELEMAGQAIVKARKLAVYGLGNSGPVAKDAEHKFLRIGIDCTAYVDSHLQVISASFLKPGDVAIGISHSGSSRDVVEALEIARDRGAKTICITNYGKSPITKVADMKLFTASQETKYRIIALASRIAQLGIIDALYSYVALRNREIAVEGMNRLESALKNKKY